MNQNQLLNLIRSNANRSVVLEVDPVPGARHCTVTVAVSFACWSCELATTGLELDTAPESEAVQELVELGYQSVVDQIVRAAQGAHIQLTRALVAA